MITIKIRVIEHMFAKYASAKKKARMLQDNSAGFIKRSIRSSCKQTFAFVQFPYQLIAKN